MAGIEISKLLKFKHLLKWNNTIYLIVCKVAWPFAFYTSNRELSFNGCLQEVLDELAVEGIEGIVAHVFHLVVNHLAVSVVLVLSDPSLSDPILILYSLSILVSYLISFEPESLGIGKGSLLSSQEGDAKGKSSRVRNGFVISSMDVDNFRAGTVWRDLGVIIIFLATVVVRRHIKAAVTVLVDGHVRHHGNDSFDLFNGFLHLNQDPTNQSCPIGGANNCYIIHVSLLDSANLWDEVLNEFYIRRFGTFFDNVPLPLVPLSRHND